MTLHDGAHSDDDDFQKAFVLQLIESFEQNLKVMLKNSIVLIKQKLGFLLSDFLFISYLLTLLIAAFD